LTSRKEQFSIRRIAELEKQLKQRDERIAALEKQVAELIKVNAELTDKVAKLAKNSSNSSKPPSSDIVKPPHPVTRAANPDMTNMKERPLRPKKLTIFKPILLIAALTVEANLKRLKTPAKLFSRLKLLKSQFTLNSIPAFVTGASIARSIIMPLCLPLLKKDN